MNANLKWTTLAVALAVVTASGSVAAQEGGRQRGDSNRHDVNVSMERDQKLKTDIKLSGDPEVTGTIDIDSAAMAVIDNRQSTSDNGAENYLLTNDASITDDVGSGASGNLQFNTAAGDNNAQDNAAALSAADASFSFGMADAEVFVNQAGASNVTLNQGVANSASIDSNAFANAAGNIGVNVTSGNNNMQKNALSASVATSAVAQSSVSSNQISSGNMVSNAGVVQEVTSSVDVALSGTVDGYTLGYGYGGYEGTTSGTTTSEGMSYQANNFYPDNWSGDTHPSGSQTGHSDWDADTQGAIANPNRPGVGGIAFDNSSEGSYEGSESGELGFIELGYAELDANLTGTVTTTDWIVQNATNTASLSGSAFSGASGNIGVNVSAGTGNLQANSLAMAVAQPSTGSGSGSE
ncbi:adhesin [Pseudoxanthomonas sp.]|uniref:adhesin n=1 Tax=Pseudoxanthomonas sp. TaxID=1871049 RepID=UPI002612DA86|nr:adhesin [Pseudoxanthomonas sp.]WDS36377.1 MAG: adhesin [Pseudoxanthomonas sp.]